MKRIETGNPARLHFQDRIGWWIVLTVPFFTAVIGFQAWMFVHFLAERPGSGGALEVLLGLVIMALLAKVVWKGIQCHVRRSLEIDAAARSATTSWGLLVPMAPTTHDLSGAIALYNALRVVDRGRYKEYFHELHAVTPTGQIKLAQSTDALELGNLSEDAAAALKLDLLEVRNGEVALLRRADEAGKHVLQIHTPPALERLLEAAPALADVTHDAGARELRVTGDGSSAALAVFVTLLSALYAAGMVLLWCSGAAVGACVGATVFATFFFGVLYFSLQPEWPSLHARPGVLEVRRRGLVFTHRKAYPVATIRAIQAKDRLLTIDSSLGGDALILSPEQARANAWLRDALLASLAQTPA
ncbi:MAG: hypothetical protein KIS92_11005 [Planctomycetota bacterium]|nr:hypothetical protein [Planctomycetota bacterium]